MLILSSSVKSVHPLAKKSDAKGEYWQTPNFLFYLTVQSRTFFFEPFQCPLWVHCGFALAEGGLLDFFIGG